MLLLVRTLASAFLLAVAFGALYVYGPLEGLTCDSEAVQFANSAQLHSILSELADTTFFRLVRVDGDGYCPIDALRTGAGEEGTCGKVVDSYSTFAPPYFSTEPASASSSVSSSNGFGYGEESLSKSVAEGASHGGGLCSIQAEATPQQVAEKVVRAISAEEKSAQHKFPRDSDCVVAGTFEIRPDYWLDLCNPLEESPSAKSPVEHVNLQLNPERNTGYNGSVVWAEMHKTISAVDSPEGKVLQRLLSGYHASVATQIMWSYYPPQKQSKTLKWRPNVEKFARHVFLPNPEYIKNMQFAFAFLARSLFKIREFLNEFPYHTGNSTADRATKDLMQHLLDTSVLSACGQVFSAFDESQMFSRAEERGIDAPEFKKAFKKVYRMTSCVTCHRCKLHATVAMHGIGAAIKILLTPEGKQVQSTEIVSRDDLVALVNTFHKFSESIALANELMSMYYANMSLTVTKSDTTGKKFSDKLHQTSGTSTFHDAIVDRELTFIAANRHRLTRLEEDALVHALVSKQEDVLTIARAFSGWPFVRHSLIALNITVPDVIVIGGGLAGLATAISAADRGANVLIIEKQASIGGNSAKASSGVNSALQSREDEELFLRDTLRSQHGIGNEELARILVERSNSSVSWLQNISGVDLSTVGQLGGHSVGRTHRPSTGVVGAELMTALARSVKNRFPSIQVVTRAKVVRFLEEPDVLAAASEGSVTRNRISGVEYALTDGRSVKQRARNVVLATGGFGFDAEGLLKHYRPDLVDFPTTLGSHTTGDGIRLASEIGAALVDMEYVQLHPTGFIDPSDPNARTKVLAAELLRGIGGILLSVRDGSRFVNELDTRKAVVDAMLERGERIYWLVLSERSVALEERLCRIYESRGLLQRITSIEALISLIGPNVTSTLTAYSDLSVVDPFGRTSKRGLPFNESSYWLVGKITPVVHYTMGGIKVNGQGRVLRGDGLPIGGLFAVGEVSGGVHGENRLGGNSLLECTVFGRIIGGESIEINEELIPSHFPRSFSRGSSSIIENSSLEKQKSEEKRKISLLEIAKHNVTEDCWTSIDGKVYDLSLYATEHPGGESAIRESCGSDATKRFSTAHSFQLLKDMEFEPIGVLDGLGTVSL